MKKETIITALVFFVLGSIAGYVFKAQRSGEAALSDPGGATPGPAQAGSAAAPAEVPETGTASASPANTALPPGHPAISDAAVVHTLEQQASQSPQDPAIPLQLANYLYDHGSYDQAVAWYQKAVQLDPRNISASTDLGTCYFNLGRYDEALQQFRHSLTIEPRHQPTLYNLVVVDMEGKHDYKSAEQAWQALHRLNPNYPNLDQLKRKLDAARN